MPESTITYTQVATPTIDIPYTLTAKNYKKFYLGETELPDLTPEEQLILLTATAVDGSCSTEQMLAGIYKAREINKRAKSKDKAIDLCHKLTIKDNLALTAFVDKVGRHRMNADKLEYYLNASNEQAKYLATQGSKMSGLFNLRNKLLQFFTKKPYTEPPHTQHELDAGVKAWRKFRKAQGASPETPNDVLLNRYKYGRDDVPTSGPNTEPFSYMFHNGEYQNLQDEYRTSVLAYKVVDGTAYEMAEKTVVNNSDFYLGITPADYFRKSKLPESTPTAPENR